MSEVKRIFIEKKKEYNIEAKYLFSDLRNYLSITNLSGLRILNRYDVEGISTDDFEKARNTIFSDPTVDLIFDEAIEISDEEYMFAIEYLPGQYDQRADSATQCIQIISQDQNPVIKTAQVIILKGKFTDNDINQIKRYLINPVDSREAFLEKPQSLHEKFSIPNEVNAIDGFISMTNKEIEMLIPDLGLAMNSEDLLFCQQYFSNKEKRDPTVTEIMMLDTYWSDHCRHTTFLTNIEKVSFEPGFLTEPIRDAYESYLDSRKLVYRYAEKPICLMDIAVIGMKELKRRGLLDDLEESDEINACSIVVT
ncbi:MAG: phosphoribosylformylglycinamidine synthase, partial [Chitinispirillia bacterium]